MLDCDDLEKLPLPGNWPKLARRAVLHAMSLMATAFKINLGRMLDGSIPVSRNEAERHRLQAEDSMLREELRIKDARMAAMPARKRAHYKATDRMAILELKAQRGWSNAQTARRFLVDDDTISSWMKRLDEEGRDALVQVPAPVNRFPEFVGYLVKRLAVLCPESGRERIADLLARAGLHLSATTVQRMKKGGDARPPTWNAERTPEEAVADLTDEKPARTVTADYPGHVWNVDLTTVPTLWGVWTMLAPFSLPQVWPLVWWVAIVQDHFSRKAMGFALFLREPTSMQVRSFLGRAFSSAGRAPKYVVYDKGKQFWCAAFKAWCRRHKIGPRYGAVGKYGSVAVIERFMRSLKEECMRRIQVPLRFARMREEIRLYVTWFNTRRPHQSLNGRTPDEVYFDWTPANEQPRYEPRKKWPRDSLCAAPWAEIKGRRGTKLELDVAYLEGRKHLPTVELKPAA